MSNLNPGNQKHLSLEDRIYIEKSLNDNKSFKDIARFLCKDPSTIFKEVKGHRLSEYLSTKGFFSNEVPLESVKLSPGLTQAVADYASQMQMAQIAEEIQKVQFALQFQVRVILGKKRKTPEECFQAVFF